MSPHRRTPQDGFSMIEILVSMVIGLVVTLIISQTVANYEGFKRTTTTGAGAQESGVFSLSTIERDVRAAGWGMPTADIMACAAYFTYFSNGTIVGPVPNFPQMPVRIVDGGTAPGASDAITVLWGTSVRSNVRDSLLQNVVPIPSGTSASNLQPATRVGLSGVGGFVWLTDDGGNCSLVQITASVANPADPTTVILSHNPGSASAGQPAYNPPDAYMAANGWPASYGANPRIFDVGTLTQRTYFLNNGSLFSQDYFSSTALVELNNNVVSVKAQYGISAAGSQVVDNWVSATNGGAGNWANPTATDAKRIKAVRVAVVTRSPLKERVPVGSVACTTTTTPPTTWPGGPAVDLSNDADWRCYRYRVFETIVPLRNVLWANLS